MTKVRIIPRLDIKGDNLVKGVNMEGLRVLGKPEDFAKLYYEMGADELLLVDVVASLYGRSVILEILEKTASEVFIPITVAGGIRTLTDISAVLRSGADKVAINSAAVANPQFLGDAVQKFGSSTIVLSLEVGLAADGSYEVFTECGRQPTGKKLLDWIKQATEFAIGEVLVTSINQEGTMSGLDLNLMKLCRENINLPLIACGGIGTQIDALKAINHTGADAIALSSALHYYYYETVKLNPEQFSKEGNTKFLFTEQPGSRKRGFALPTLKSFLKENGVTVRI